MLTWPILKQLAVTVLIAFLYCGGCCPGNWAFLFRKDVKVLKCIPRRAPKLGQAGRHLHMLWGAAEDRGYALFWEEEAEGQPHCSLQPPEEQKRRWRCWALLPAAQCQHVWERLKAASLRGGLALTGGNCLRGAPASWHPRAVCASGGNSQSLINFQTAVPNCPYHGFLSYHQFCLKT